MVTAAAPAAPNGDNGNLQGHCSQCGKIWTLNERQGVCQWCNKPASCQSSTSKPRHIKSRSNGRRKQPSTNGNGYDHLEGEWLTYYKVALPFANSVPDREDLLHTIIANLADLIRRSSTKNQFFIITHDPLFIYPDFIHNLNRFYLKGKNTGTVKASMSGDLSARDIGQIKTASRDISKRELYFARAVLFVEDESQKRFIEGCAKKLDYSLDSVGLSIVEVGGQDGFEPYIKLAEQLDIPFLCLRDLPWGSGIDRPSKIYRSLSCELEQYLKQVGCSSLMEQAKKTVGTSKQRVAEYCGEHIERVKIPPFFTQLLEDAMKLCKKRDKK